MTEPMGLRKHARRTFGVLAMASLTATSLLLAGCDSGTNDVPDTPTDTASARPEPVSVGEVLGDSGSLEVGIPLEVGTFVWTADSLGELSTKLETMGLKEIADSLSAVGGSSDHVVSAVYDACTKSLPGLSLDDKTLTVVFGEEREIQCLRTEPAVAVFKLPLDQMPDGWVLESCGQKVNVSRNGVNGEPIGLC